MEEEYTTIKLPKAPRFWQLFVERRVELFVCALARLAQWDGNPDIPREQENDVSKLLCVMLTDVCSEWNEKYDMAILVPAWECPKAPRVTSDLLDVTVGKRPDFTCVCPNPRPGSHDNIEIPLHIECKIIGKDKGRQTKYKRHYVDDGIVRFDNESHKYGKGANHGMMIGYLVGESAEAVQHIVNQVIKKDIADHGPLCISFDSSKVGESKNVFSRRYVDPQPFTLIHLWVDLRDNPFFRT